MVDGPRFRQFRPSGKSMPSGNPSVNHSRRAHRASAFLPVVVLLDASSVPVVASQMIKALSPEACLRKCRQRQVHSRRPSTRMSKIPNHVLPVVVPE